jgi:hypothetical protein
MDVREKLRKKMYSIPRVDAPSILEKKDEPKKTVWFAKKTGCPNWHRVVDIVDSKQGGNLYHLEGFDSPFHQSQIEDLATGEELGKADTPKVNIGLALRQKIEGQKKYGQQNPNAPKIPNAEPKTIDYSQFTKKEIKPGPTIDYSKFTRPTDSTTGVNKPIHNPIQHSAPESLKKSAKTNVAAMLVAMSMAKPTSEPKTPIAAQATSVAPAQSAPQQKQEAPQADTSKFQVHEVAAKSPEGAQVRIHTAGGLPHYNVGGQWYQPQKMSEDRDFLEKNPHFAPMVRDAQVKRYMIRAHGAKNPSKAKEGFVYN